MILESCREKIQNKVNTNFYSQQRAKFFAKYGSKAKTNAYEGKLDDDRKAA